MEAFKAWWAARTGRERKLVQGAALFVLMILLPGWAYLSAAQFREDAAVRLTAARAVAADVARLEQGGPAQDAGGATLRDRVLTLAEANGLAPQALESADATRVRVVFGPSDSLMIYRWIDAIGRTGAMVSRSAVLRSGESDLVSAEFEVLASP